MATIIPVESFDCAVFGGTGDLAMRKLLPALFHRFLDRQFPDDSRIIGASRREVSDDTYRGLAEEALRRHVPPERFDLDEVRRFCAMLGHERVDGRAGDGFDGLARRLQDAPDKVRVFYMATSPDLQGPISRNLAAAKLVTTRSRVVPEKPIGRDLASARRSMDEVATAFSEAQTFRIDHYLGKETVQNLLALRFANPLIERTWNTDAIDHVQITVAETVGLEERGGYYDEFGAGRDMLLGHMLQLLCLLAMECPTSLDADAVRDEKVRILRSLRPMTAADLRSATVRGQYTEGAIGGRPVPGYLADLGGERRSTTETFALVRAEIANWRWGGTPFYLRTGKRMATKMSQVVVFFRAPRFSVFPADAGELQPNALIIRLQPDEGIRLAVMAKQPGPGGLRLSPTELDLSFETAFRTRYPDAYERLLMDVVRGNQTLFMRRDEVEAGWAWMDPILAGWAADPQPPRPYAAGSWGPSASVALIERDGRSWRDD
ncbi:glucose-6-phosphate dehydrogenase [Paracraurococcus lichenis]|uniref:Glucose-6-phosphate 1-dehydrogenase n=1 Tax=Paracraurococcus lichenis TaxID=3064888 RepID=A0ABT9EB91_9PROT|nr:glucose-6-phosphate dehydrogenase [Paracraurococcus sp. LOR1-02]MDO9713470.1 glucose-6-phosphate dehydrogenase [Paracraurococcus sp. LOR1-02]